MVPQRPGELLCGGASGRRRHSSSSSILARGIHWRRTAPCSHTAQTMWEALTSPDGTTDHGVQEGGEHKEVLPSLCTALLRVAWQMGFKREEECQRAFPSSLPSSCTAWVIQAAQEGRALHAQQFPARRNCQGPTMPPISWLAVLVTWAVVGGERWQAPLHARTLSNCLSHLYGHTSPVGELGKVSKQPACVNYI